MNQSKPIITILALSGYILYLILTLLFNRNFYLQQQMLFQHIFVLLIVGLFIEKKAINLPCIRDIFLVLMICVVGFLSVHSSENYLKSSIKMKLDISIIFTCFILYVCFMEHFKKHVMLILSVLIVPWLVVSWTTFSEMYILEGQGLVLKRWGYLYYSHIRHFSNHVFIVFCISYILFRCVYKRHGLDFLTTFPLLLITTYSLLLLCLSASRASLLSLVLFVFLWALFNKSKVEAIKESVVLIVVLFLIYIVLMFTPFHASSDLILGKFTSLFYDKVEVTSKFDDFTSGRLDIWKDSLLVALEKPIYGHGAASYQWLSLRGSNINAHSHNAVVQFILEYGYLGGLLIVVLLFRLCKKLYAARDHVVKNRELYNGLLALVFSFLFYTQFTGMLFHPLPILYFCLLLTILASMSKLNSQ